jgi:glycosyltransferase involved in cell wall biosynthesis
LISIITPSLNRAGFIVEAIESVLSQDYPAIEHIIVDGGSTDGTLDILKRYPHLRVISEPDQGLYDAINKGIRLARGEIIGLLNTDDCYAPNVFSPLAACFLENPDTLCVCGAASYFMDQDQRQETILRLPPITARNLPERLTTGIPAINSCLFRKSVFDRIGYFDLAYRLAADRDFLFRFACAGLPLVSIEEAVYRYRSHPGSLTVYDVWKPKILEENLQLAVLYAEQTANIPIRKACLKWENRYTLEIIGHFFRKKDFGTALKYFRRASRRHWWWPFYFMPAFPITVANWFIGNRREI